MKNDTLQGLKNAGFDLSTMLHGRIPHVACSGCAVDRSKAFPRHQDGCLNRVYVCACDAIVKVTERDSHVCGRGK